MSKSPFNGLPREEVVKIWVAALRSGEYQQVQEVLHADGGFCCLGVLCDLNSKLPGQPEWDRYSEYMDNDLELPAPLACFIVKPGMPVPPAKCTKYNDISDEEFNANVITGKYAKLNDEGSTFAQLADIIEKDLL